MKQDCEARLNPLKQGCSEWKHMNIIIETQIMPAMKMTKALGRDLRFY